MMQNYQKSRVSGSRLKRSLIPLIGPLLLANISYAAPMPIAEIINVTQAQTSVTGTVKDDKGLPLPGVSVKLKGTTIGAISDANGKFNLKVPSISGTLVFVSVGYKSLEVPLTGRIINVSLKEDAVGLEDVVVIGYGTVKRRDLTGAVASVKADDIVKTPTNNPLEAVQGMVPGLDITRSSGNAGASMNVQLRGTRTINGSSNPLYIIDGVQGDNLETVNPNDIESIEVLKDASSTAIYGSQGANGVVIVTTKKGKAGTTKINYSGYYGIDGMAQYPEARLGDSYIALRREAYRTTGVWNSAADDTKIFSSDEYNAIQNNQWVNWLDLLMQNGTRQSHNVSFASGTEKTKSYFSAGYFGTDGLVKNNDLKQYNALANIDQTWKKWAKGGIHTAVAHLSGNAPGTDPFSVAMTTQPFGTPFNADGSINVFPMNGNEGILSPLADNRGRETSTNNTLTTRLALNGYIELTPIAGLTFRSVFGSNIVNSRNGQFYSATARKTVNTRRSEASLTTNNSRSYNWDNILTYSREFGDHSLTLTGLTSYTNGKTEDFSAYGQDLVYSTQLFYNLASTNAANRQISSGYVGTATMSYAGRINYSYKGKYLVTLTNRYDGASRLSEGYKWTSFPSAAVAWRISDEDFMKDVSAVSDLKLRASYGVAGNSGIKPYGTQSLMAVQRMGFENTPAAAYIYGSILGNKNLGWEISKTANIGVDVGFLNSRINASIDVYNTNTSDILLLRNLPPDLGVASTYQNVGSTRNQGIEVIVNSRNIDSKNFKWNTVLSFSANKERITSLISGTDIFSSSAETGSLLIGHPINSFYNYQKLGIWQTDEADAAAALKFGNTPFQPGDIKLADLNNDGFIKPGDDRTYIGSAVPKWTLGMQNTLNFKGFDFSVYCIARWGQMIKNELLGRYNPAGEGNNGPAYFNYWTPENATNDYPRPRANTNLNAYAGNTTLLYVDGSYFKVRSMSLGYTFSQKTSKKLFVNNLRAYVSCNNPYVTAKSHLVKYYDPERGGSEDSPLTRQFVFGINFEL